MFGLSMELVTLILKAADIVVKTTDIVVKVVLSRKNRNK